MYPPSFLPSSVGSRVISDISGRHIWPQLILGHGRWWQEGGRKWAAKGVGWFGFGFGCVPCYLDKDDLSTIGTIMPSHTLTTYSWCNAVQGREFRSSTPLQLNSFLETSTRMWEWNSLINAISTDRGHHSNFSSRAACPAKEDWSEHARKYFWCGAVAWTHDLPIRESRLSTIARSANAPAAGGGEGIRIFQLTWGGQGDGHTWAWRESYPQPEW